VFFNRFSWSATSRDPQSRQVYQLAVASTGSNITVFSHTWRSIPESDSIIRNKEVHKGHTSVCVLQGLPCALECGKYIILLFLWNKQIQVTIVWILINKAS
jgi:hypothetical protein